MMTPELAIQARRLTKRFGDFTAVDGHLRRRKLIQ